MVALVAAPLESRGASWVHLDAESLGRGGIATLSRLDLSPGAPVEPGLVLAATAAELVVGSDLLATSLRAQLSRPPRAAAICLGQLQSAVGRETELDLAL